MAVHLSVPGVVFDGVLFLCCPFSHEMSWMRSGTELNQFLEIYIPTLPMPGRPTNLDYSRIRAYFACRWCGRMWFGHLFNLLYHFSRLLSSLWETARYRLKYSLKEYWRMYVHFVLFNRLNG